MTLLTPPELLAARDWLASCDWPDVDPGDVYTMPAARIEQAVERHYDGGLDRFIAECFEISCLVAD